MDGNLFKTIVSGEDQSCEVLFGATTQGKTKCKIITTSNNDLTMANDGGINRRGILQKYTSQFLEIDEDVEEKKKYKLMEQFSNVFHDPEMKVAFLHLLIKHPELKITAKFKDGFKDMLTECDPIVYFIEQHFVITPNMDKNRILRDDLMAFCANNNKNFKTIVAKLKPLGVVYDRDYSMLDYKGYSQKKCYMNVSFKN
jgi:hypothetical protein